MPYRFDAGNGIIERRRYTQFVFIRIRYKNIEAQIREKLRIC